jgi:hypothetical protein
MTPSASTSSRSATRSVTMEIQPIDQFLTAAGRQAMHAHRRMAGIVEIVDDVERQTVAVRQPFDRRRRTLRHRGDNCAIGFAMRLALDVGGK